MQVTSILEQLRPNLGPNFFKKLSADDTIR